MSFHQYSWNSEVETTWISLIGWPQKMSSLYVFLLCWLNSAPLLLSTCCFEIANILSIHFFLTSVNTKNFKLQICIITFKVFICTWWKILTHEFFTPALCLYVYLSSRKQKNVRAGISHLLKLSRSWLSLSYWLFFCLFPFKNDLMRKWALKLLLGTKKVRCGLQCTLLRFVKMFSGLQIFENPGPIFEKFRVTYIMPQFAFICILYSSVVILN